VPTLPVPERPTEADAGAALLMLRTAFRTFPFADAVREEDPPTGIALVDVTTPPGADESAFLTALLTAAARPSLYLAPALLISAPVISGAGNGKGLLARCISAIAFGVQPRAFGAGHDQQELDKRLAAELMGAAPVLLLDNVNATALKNDTLASAITERPSSVRVMRTSKMVTINSTAFIMVTGNGLSLSEDLARRFVEIALDAGMEDPEQRPFRPGFLKSIQAQRPELLTACMTILRFGRQNATRLVTGTPLGSFETWGAWVRDPLLTLGCLDPVDRLRVAKLNDPQRRQITDIFQSWWDAHRDQPTKAADLADGVRTLIDPQARGRQYVASRLQSIAGTRAAGFVLTHQPPAGKWGGSTYALKPAPQPSAPIGHRTDRTHGGCTPTPGAADASCQNGAQPAVSAAGANNDASRADAIATDGAGEEPMTPLGPMPDSVEGADAGIEDDNWEGEI
jgi:putative DNA primase/helicase